ncbi:membrane bound o-acyl transferase mboat family protein [Rhodopirellula maiorica SM1]|uniref:Membrane bound o-acyl transferase mboat family protein n=1 Tax=Rhodopirellula maiorica SM1 TaxID=1265738 RepID=M5RQ36_9BACT|nr:MBOAT family O-acyltransferase [Rhodopirellula maiorica]EMI16079.1 membrane bound o-acyl transferase mboat family protein [Rhodopirellula maiorica SM1]
MLFNSLAFAIFLLLTFVCYWWLQRYSLRVQNTLLLLSSYFFYGCWDWRFLCLIAISSAIDFVVGIQLGSTTHPRYRKRLLTLSIIANLGILGFFKYYGFFVDSFIAASEQLGFQAHPHTLQIILPVGISFYTFQSLSYTIDVYRRHVQPTRDWIAFFAYVSFFPQLVAGPIERAAHLLPQFLCKRTFNLAQAKDGLRQILWGLFKKVVIADNLAPLVDEIFVNYSDHNGVTLLLGVLYFAIQIYCDFSGYSDIAIGTARLFGFDLMQNFAYPYFSRDIGEFWRRWHISLSTWFRDYVYIPLGGSRKVSKAHHLANLIVTFTVSGFWHGANWTFVVWGLLHGLYYLPLVMTGNHKRHHDIVATGRWLPNLREFVQMGSTFALVLLAWVFFRADSVSHAISFISHMMTSPWRAPTLLKGLPYLALLFTIEWVQRSMPHALQIEHMPVWVRWPAYYSLIVVMFLYGNTGHVPFIYFQF